LIETVSKPESVAQLLLLRDDGDGDDGDGEKEDANVKSETRKDDEEDVAQQQQQQQLPSLMAQVLVLGKRGMNTAKGTFLTPLEFALVIALAGIWGGLWFGVAKGSDANIAKHAPDVVSIVFFIAAQVVLKLLLPLIFFIRMVHCINSQPPTSLSMCLSLSLSRRLCPFFTTVELGSRFPTAHCFPKRQRRPCERTRQQDLLHRGLLHCQARL
jgi:hypothetical protein